MITLHTSPTATLGHNANGGLNVYVREVCAAFSRRGIATDVFTRCLDSSSPTRGGRWPEGPEGAGRRGGCPTVEQLTPLSRVIYLPAGLPGLNKYRLLHEVPDFTDQVEDFITAEQSRSEPYDLIYSHYWLSGLSACALRGRLGLPWAHTAHTLGLVKNRQLAPGDQPEPEVRVELEGEISRCADLLVVSTQAEADDLRRAYHVPPDRFAVIAPGVDLVTFRPRSKAIARLLVGHRGHRLFVFVGRLEPLKGVDVILRAFALLTADGSYANARLLVLGEDGGAAGCSEMARLQAMAQELGICDRVEFVGSVPQDRLPAYYAAADACLMPSYSESFGLVGLEAQACGTAVVASNVAGLASIVRDGVTGFLVDGHEPAAYADRLRLLLEEPALAHRMGWRGSRMARGFSWERTADSLLERFAALTPQVGVQAALRQE